MYTMLMVLLLVVPSSASWPAAQEHGLPHQVRALVELLQLSQVDVQILEYVGI